MTDPIDFGKELGMLIKEATAPLKKEIEELKSREPEKGEAGKDADPVDLDALASLVIDKLFGGDRLKTLVDLVTSESVAKHMEENPARDGKDADPEVIKKAVSEAVAAIPAPSDGKDADPVSEAQIAAEVARYLQANPVKDGESGVGLAGAMIDRSGHLMITTTKGENINLGKVVGEDGRDGLTFEDVTGEHDSERGFVISVGRGDRKKEFTLPYMVNRGFWTAGVKTLSGQNITHDGALWIAKRDTCAEPCLANADDWQLAARKGRDGKDGKSVKVPMQPVKLGAGNG